MAKQKNHTAKLITFLSLLTFFFIGLKLARFIDWHWTWVASPLWIPSLLIIGYIILIKAIN